MKRISIFLSIAAFGCLMAPPARADVSKAYVSDLGNGKYQNPIINADYSDPDVVRVGNDYYMTSSSFANLPALQILHSNDLVNWTIVGAVADKYPDPAFDGVSHGNGVWAPSIRYHNGKYYVMYGDPDRGIYVADANDPKGPWSPLRLIYPVVGVIDPCPFWDEDGRAYIAHGYAGSRAGVKSILGMIEMTPDATGVIGVDRVIYDGHLENETIEGAKMYKRGPWYYIFSPAGGVATGWQVVMRSKNPWGPYEQRNVMEQGNTDINGPHQGAWVDTPDGKEHWFIHFQDKGPYGRVVNLEPMEWKEDGWPVIGVDKDGDGRGIPVRTYKKPNVGKSYPIATPQDSDEFDSTTLGYQWQWNGNPQPLWYFCDAENSVLRLFSHNTPDAQNLCDMQNVLMQKFPNENFTATAKVAFHPRVKDGKAMVGEKGGIAIMGYNFATLALESREDGTYLVQTDCVGANKGKEEVETAAVKLDTNGPIWLQAVVRMTGAKTPKAKPDYKCTVTFRYSLDGKKFTDFGRPMNVLEGHWIGAKVGIFCTRPWKSNDSGWLDID
ncbi:MAG: glycoside hydrolase 43 family protein, partial [Muribaculaceae bacterium]|nr:glycoside hydrolase 43 family protein [Muribaculaceae bacterium]